MNAYSRPLILVQILMFLALWMAIPEPCLAVDAAEGSLEGSIVSADGAGLAGVPVTLEDPQGDSPKKSTTTDGDGSFRFDRLPVGEWALSLHLADRILEERVHIAAGNTARLQKTVDPPKVWTDSILVTAASRRAERVVDSPSAVTILSSEEIERRPQLGQVPLLLAATPGVEIAQNGLYDINFNSRGFNNGVNRRVMTLVDGLDPSLPLFSGAQEWAALSLRSEELETVELVRGPNAALYGAGAFNGVLNIVTRDAHTSLGGLARLSMGELDANRLTARHAGPLGEAWFFKFTGGLEGSDTFTQSRLNGAEYDPDTLPRDLIPLPKDRVQLSSGSVRLEYTGWTSGQATLEAGVDQSEGTTLIAAGGRFQRLDVDRPWFRLAYDDAHWHVQGTYSSRVAEEALLSAGIPIFYDQQRFRIEAQRGQNFHHNKGHWLGGLTVGGIRVDTADPNGRQTLLAEESRSEFGAVFGQITYRLHDRLQGVLSLRLDESDLHDTRVSPRLALVYRPSDRHTLRLNIGEGFQSPTLVELGLMSPVAAPLDLSSLETDLGLPGLGLGQVPVLAVGHPALAPEEITNFEVGYSGTFGRRFLLTANLFHSELSNFVTALLPFTGTSLGRLHDQVTSYAPPTHLSDAEAGALLDALRTRLGADGLAGLSLDADGNPFLAALSITNFGEVRTRGAEIAAFYNLPRWRIQLAYTLFDFEIKKQLENSPLQPNAPDYSLGATVAYIGDRFDAALAFRWVPEFQWLSGIYNGLVSQYSVADLMVRVPLGQRWKVGLEVANALNDEHIELYGGDLLSRRAMIFAELSW